MVASIFAARNWRRTSRMLYAVAIILIFAIGCGPGSAWLLRGLQSPYRIKPVITWHKHNAIILLGAGTEKISRVGNDSLEPGLFAYGRIVEAAESYQDCREKAVDCKIIVSGGDAQHHGQAEALVYRTVLMRLGIRGTDILTETHSMNTWQNAQFTSALLKKYRPDYVLLVTSGYHLRRSMLYFMHFGVHAVPMRADYLHVKSSPLPQAYNFMLADVALDEYIGIARFYVYSFLGWNA